MSLLLPVDTALAASSSILRFGNSSMSLVRMPLKVFIDVLNVPLIHVVSGCLGHPWTGWVNLHDFLGFQK